ncbi:MAG: SUMF1/EgtB/PvdO family nonheme iron enzyme [Albidovulum sp.]|uniref:formylglycine-generating enzyme family protein n=1 Tax=Albidovulum sp. TaxID=1872424 RepID=UPI003C865BF8
MVWLLVVTVGLFGLSVALATFALRDLDRAVSEGDIGRPLSAPKAAGLFVAAQLLPLRQPGGAVTEEGRSFRDCADCPEMVGIRPGMFLMGSPVFEPGRYEHIWDRPPIRRQLKFVNREGPRRLVRIAYPFALARYELTYAEWDRAQDDPDWERLTGLAPRKPERADGAGPDWAVTRIDQIDANAYAAWLSAKTGQSYRIPTEAEWEYAARAGTTTVYHWGDDVGIDNAACRGCSTKWTTDLVGPVGLHPPNGFGLYDMIGNGWEWVEDCFVPWHDPVKTDGSAHVFEDCELVVFKGGTAIAEPWQARAAMRVGPHPYNDGRGSVIRLLREMPAP